MSWKPPHGPSFEFVTETQLAPPAAFERVTDWPAHVGPGTTVQVTHSTPDGVGTTLVARTACGPVGFDDRMVVRVFAPPSATQPVGHCVIEKVGPLLAGWAQIEVAAQPTGGSLVRWQEQVRCGEGKLGHLSAAVSAAVGPIVFRPLVQKLVAV